MLKLARASFNRYDAVIQVELKCERLDKMMGIGVYDTIEIPSFSNHGWISP
jgi:hypothetical protein